MRPLNNIVGGALVVLAATTAPIAVAQTNDAPAATLRDSTLKALVGRAVVVTTSAGLSAKGELAGFDEETITLIKPDKKVAVIQRADIEEVSVDAPAAEAAPPAPPAKVESERGDAGSSASEEEDGDKTKLPPVRIAQPWQPGVRSTHPDLSPYEQELHVMSGATTDYCVNGAKDDTCREVLTLGAEQVRRQGTSSAWVGLGVGVGLGAIGLGLGAWRLDIGLAEAEAQEACEALSGFGSSACDELNPGLNIGLGTVGVLGGSALIIVGGVLAGVGFSRSNEADSFLQRQRVSFTPIAGPETAGLAITGDLF